MMEAPPQYWIVQTSRGHECTIDGKSMPVTALICFAASEHRYRTEQKIWFDRKREPRDDARVAQKGDYR